MKRKSFLMAIASLLTLTALVACDETTSGATSNSPTSASIPNSDLGSVSKPGLPSLPSLSDQTSTGSDEVLAVLNTLAYAADRDMDGVAVAKEYSLEYEGYEDGVRLHQEQTASEKTYLTEAGGTDIVTIGTGSASQYYYSNPDNVYSDTFKNVRIIKQMYYIDARTWDNKVYKDSTTKHNIMLDDPNDIQNSLDYYNFQVSCGAAFGAVMTLYQYQSSYDFTVKQSKVGTDFIIEVHGEMETDETQNQKGIIDFKYTLDNAYFLKEYVCKQSFYRLSDYKNSEDPSKLTPMEYSNETTSVTKGTYEVFEGDLPIDIDASFVQSISITATKTTIEVGEEIALKTTVLPETAIDKSVSFSSDNTGIAVVDNIGTVRGITTGTVTIRARSMSSEVEGTIEITVVEKSRPDGGDDTKKTDLQLAFDAALYQYFERIAYDFEYSCPPAIDGDGSINSTSLSTLSISDFLYNENKREATYIGNDWERIARIFPYVDNGNENLSNRYYKNGDTMWRNVIVDFVIKIDSNNKIAYMILETRNDTAEVSRTLDIKNVNAATVDTDYDWTINPYTIKTKYESAGFDYSYEE